MLNGLRASLDGLHMMLDGLRAAWAFKVERWSRRPARSRARKAALCLPVFVTR
jgi:hypothetical protein